MCVHVQQIKMYKRGKEVNNGSKKIDSIDPKIYKTTVEIKWHNG